MKALLSMTKSFKWVPRLTVLILILSAGTALAGHIEKVDINGILSDVYVPDVPESRLSEDGNTLFNSPPVIVVADPNPSSPLLRIPPPPEVEAGTTEHPSAMPFSITYKPAGSQDPWGQTCETFPTDAQAAFTAAANVWGSLLTSTVPIAIVACWSNLGAVSTLGYSGGGHLYRNFSNAPRTDTWYGESLANALAGTDQNATAPNMYITYNSNFPWYYGTDGTTPAGQYDLMSVVLHEIAHGLNFAGSMSYSSSSGLFSWGYGTPYPNIYDTFMYDGTGTQLTNTTIYPKGSAALGNVLTSNNIWFHGSNAMTANSDTYVKIYAPSSWVSGSSYSHLDYNTFRATANALMVYAIAPGVSIHSPGSVTMGLLKDLGWSTSSPPPTPTARPNLRPYRPSYWSQSLVVTHYQGSTVNSPLYAGYKIYVDWAVANLGKAETRGKFYVRLYVDGRLKKTWAVRSLEKGYYRYCVGAYIGGLSRGSHRLKLVADEPNRVNESRETDNTCVRRVTVR